MKNVNKTQVQEFLEVDKELEEVLKKQFSGKKISRIMLVQPYWQDRFSEFNLSASDFDIGV